MAYGESVTIVLAQDSDEDHPPLLMRLREITRQTNPYNWKRFNAATAMFQSTAQPWHLIRVNEDDREKKTERERVKKREIVGNCCKSTPKVTQAKCRSPFHVNNAWQVLGSIAINTYRTFVCIHICIYRYGMILVNLRGSYGKWWQQQLLLPCNYRDPNNLMTIS